VVVPERHDELFQNSDLLVGFGLPLEGLLELGLGLFLPVLLDRHRPSPHRVILLGPLGGGLDFDELRLEPSVVALEGFDLGRLISD
jgi:hypothetical protein